MKRQTQVRRNGSTSAARSQLTTPQGSVRRRKLPNPPGFKPSPNNPACLCIFDGIAGDFVCKIPISPDEWCSTIIEANRQGVLPDQFVADAIREKLARKPAASTLNPPRPVPEAGQEDAHDRLELSVPAAVAAISVLSDAYWDEIDSKNEYQRMHADGLISLAYHASCQLQTESRLACEEWCKVHRATPLSSQSSGA
jgi:hypothetical protein